LTNEGISAAAFTGPDNIRPKVDGGVNDFEMTILATWSRRSIAYRDRGGEGRRGRKKRKRKRKEEKEKEEESKREREGGREGRGTGRSRREQPRRRMRSVKQRDAANDAGRCNFVRK